MTSPTITAPESIVDQAIDTFGRLDVLVNVAGILRDRMVFNMSEEDWDAVIRVHLKGTFNTAHYAAAYWRSQRDTDGHFRLINFTSGSGLHGAPVSPTTPRRRWAIVGFTYSCANALRPYGVTSNAISPGAATRMTESVPDGRRRTPTADGSDERSPDDVAPAVAFLGQRSLRLVKWSGDLGMGVQLASTTFRRSSARSRRPGPGPRDGVHDDRGVVPAGRRGHAAARRRPV